MKPLYSVGDYDKQLTLKMGQNLWLILVFLLSPYIVIILSLSNTKNTMELINSIYPSTNFVRRIWRNGRKILIFSAALKIIFIFAPGLFDPERKLEMVSWIQVALSVITLAYLYRAQRVKDVFKDFPQAHAQDQ